MTSERRLSFITVLVVAVLFSMLSGCASKVDYAVDREFSVVRPSTVAVAPVQWTAAPTDGSDEIARYFMDMSVEKLKGLNYAVASTDEVARRFAEDASLAAATPAEAAGLLGVDTVLYIDVTEWDPDTVLTYVSLSIRASFDLYSATGARVWSASYQTSEGGLSLDRDYMELAMIEIYEPRVQRFVDAVFSTLPPNEARVEKRRFFDWLP